MKTPNKIIQALNRAQKLSEEAAEANLVFSHYLQTMTLDFTLSARNDLNYGLVKYFLVLFRAKKNYNVTFMFDLHKVKAP